MKVRHLSYLFKVLLLFFVYFSTARIGLSLDAVSKFATLVWFPSGLALAFLLLFGYRLWPGIIAAAFLVNFSTGASLGVSSCIAVGNTLEALMGAYLLKRCGFHLNLSHLSDVILLVVIGCVSTGISATIGVSSLYFGGIVSSITYSSTWLVWWVGDVISILIFCPLILVWSSPFLKSIRRAQIMEVVLLVLFVIAVGRMLFPITVPIDSFPITYLVFLPLIWSCLRFGQRGGVTFVFLLCIFAILHTFKGGSDKLLLLQCFMGIIAVTSLILAAVESERRDLEQRKDEFIGLASHELRTPLTSVKAYTQLLEKLFIKQADKQAASYANKMDRQIDRLSILVDDLLDVSKIQVGKLELHKDRFSLYNLIIETVEVVQETVATHDIVVKKVVEKSADKIYADKERIGQVIINLLTNAIKYSPKADRVIVRVLFAEKKAVVSIRDFGIGIAKDQQRKIFDRYYRIGGGYGKASSGLGIGLYISQEIIKQSGGKLWVEKEKGKGSTFYFSLPV